MESLLVLLMTLGFALLMVAYVGFSWGFVVWKFWYWFLLPVFPALPAITFIQAVGIMFFISLFKTTPSQTLKDDYINKQITTAMFILAPWIAFAAGWFIKLLIY